MRGIMSDRIIDVIGAGREGYIAVICIMDLITNENLYNNEKDVI